MFRQRRTLVHNEVKLLGRGMKAGWGQVWERLWLLSVLTSVATARDSQHSLWYPQSQILDCWIRPFRFPTFRLGIEGLSDVVAGKGWSKILAAQHRRTLLQLRVLHVRVRCSYCCSACGRTERNPHETPQVPQQLLQLIGFDSTLRRLCYRNRMVRAPITSSLCFCCVRPTQKVKPRATRPWRLYTGNTPSIFWTGWWTTLQALIRSEFIHSYKVQSR